MYLLSADSDLVWVMDEGALVAMVTPAIPVVELAILLSLQALVDSVHLPLDCTTQNTAEGRHSFKNDIIPHTCKNREPLKILLMHSRQVFY